MGKFKDDVRYFKYAWADSGWFERVSIVMCAIGMLMCGIGFGGALMCIILGIK